MTDIDENANQTTELDLLREENRKFRRLLNPVWMALVYKAMGNLDSVPSDDTYIFAHMGGGGSDYSSFGQFRELMGDEREAVKKMDEDIPY